MKPEQERLVVPGLGVVILAGVLLLEGASTASTVVLGLLGVGAIATFFAPEPVQVETRIGIAAVGLLYLILFFGSWGLWLVVLGLGGIGALQIRHRSELQRTPVTIAWLNAQRAEGKIGLADVVFVLLGLLVLLSATMPWGVLILSFAGESEAASFTGPEAAEVLSEAYGSTVVNLIFGAGVVLAVASMAAAFVPRFVPRLAGLAGMLLTAFAFIYVYAGYADGVAGSGVSALTLPNVGFFVTGGAFLVITLLSFKSKPKPAESAPEESEAEE